MTHDPEALLRSIFKKILQLPDDSMDDELTAASIPAWDSFNALMLISEIESAFHIRFSMEETRNIRSLGDFKTALRAHGVRI